MNLVRQQFIWSHKNQTKNDSAMFQIYKLTVAAYLISMSFYGWRDQKLNPKNIHGEFSKLPKYFRLLLYRNQANSRQYRIVHMI